MRVSKQDWLLAALDIIEQYGRSALTIERLCKKMKKTKGGFYHHFEDAFALQEAILEEWEQRQTSAFIEAADQTEDRNAALNELAMSSNWNQERAIRAWAFENDDVRIRVESVDRRRIAYLGSLFEEHGCTNTEDLALIEYAAFIGAQHLSIASANPKERTRMSNILHRALERHGRR